MQDLLQPQPEAQPQPQEETLAAATVVDVGRSLPMDGAVRHEITKLVQNLFLLPESPRRVVFSGTEAGCGCSWTCARTAEVLASQVAGSVCVVDCNLRSPGLHQQFGSENHNGLTDLLVQSQPVREYVHRLGRANLCLLSCGSASADWQTLIGSDRMRSRLAELRSAFDYILIDAAPLNTCNDALVLGALSDGVVLVMKANSSRRDTAQKALHGLRAARVRALGAVLNERTFPVPAAIYKRL
ncbi:MAG: CpsD/CapB family tyrosine-protein kinase [Acidobacteria bacterium]|nr:CpsD/CapB family tyrosine-protein kinase [Acidobacteriota bacterium]